MFGISSSRVSWVNLWTVIVKFSGHIHLLSHVLGYLMNIDDEMDIKRIK